MAELECRLCGGENLSAVVERPRSAVLQNRVFESAAEARAARAGQLDIRRCAACGFMHNYAFDPALVEYVPEYENEQGNSAHFRAHMAGLIDQIASAADAMASREAGPLSVVDIGCGQGGFLEEVLSRLGTRACGFGFDAAFRGAEVETGDRRYYRRYFDGATGYLVPDGPVIMVTRHVIEHVPDPVGFLRGIRAAIRPAQQVRLYIETPCAEWIFRNRVVQDFFYEHCNYWTADSLSFAAARAGFATAGVRHVFSGQYLWLEAMPEAEAAQADAHPDTISDGALIEAYRAAEAATLGNWRNRVHAMAKEGGVALWGAGGKGVTMASLLDPQAEEIACLIDINCNKQGRFVPVTGHPVVDARTAVTRYGVRTAIVMNPNYRDEIAAALDGEGLQITLVDETEVRP